MHVLTGKGMHDGAGAWVKSAAARAVLSGVGIASVDECFDYCVTHLHSNTKRKNFTSAQFFHLISPETLATYRASMPATVSGSMLIKARKGSTMKTGNTLFIYKTLCIIMI